MTDEDLRRLFEGAVGGNRPPLRSQHRRSEREVRIAGEGLIRLDQKFDRSATDIRDQMRRGFAGTQAMIKFSHAQLDRRIRTSEEGFAHWQARVERLESTH